MDVRRRLTVLLLGAALVVGACGDDGEAAGATGATDTGGRLQIATTVAPITSIVSQVVGDRADITGIVPEGTNSHTFEPAPSVAELLSEADVISVNGLKLEDPTMELAEQNLRDDARLVELGTEV